MNIRNNRQSSKYSPRELAGRLLWGFCSPLFRWSPRICWGWRRLMLRCFGAKVGRQVQIDPSARVFLPWNLDIGDWSSVGFDALLYNLGPLKIGDRATISHRAHLCGGTHDFRANDMPLERAAITVGDEAWICADAFVGPRVKIGRGAVVGARAVAMRDVEAGSVVAGNPCRVVGKR